MFRSWLVVIMMLIARPGAAGEIPAEFKSALDVGVRFVEKFLHENPPPQIAGLPSPQIVWSVDHPSSFRAMSLSYQAISGLDWFTTVRALNNGHREANPVLAPVASNPTALLVTKSVSMIATLYVAERLWQRNRAAAVATMVAANVIMGCVVVHNTSVGGQPRRPRH